MVSKPERDKNFEELNQSAYTSTREVKHALPVCGYRENLCTQCDRSKTARLCQCAALTEQFVYEPVS